MAQWPSLFTNKCNIVNLRHMSKMQDAQHSSNHDSNISKLIFRFYRVSYFPFYFTIFRETIGGGGRVHPAVTPVPIGTSTRWGSPHWSVDARGSLIATFPNWWIGRDGPIYWPPRSPLDFFLWGYAKDRVFAIPVNDTGELRTRIRDVIAIITGEMLTRTLQEFD